MMDQTPARKSNHSAAFSDARKVLAEAVETHAFPGCAYGVLMRDTVLEVDALGRFTYDNDSPIVHPETVFDIASITKVACTTALAMLLHQRNLLELDLPLAEVLPGFIVGRPRKEQARHVTIRHVLAHSSGLPGYLPLFKTATTREEMLRACLRAPLEAAPGTRAEYSDIGFMLMGKVVEVLAGNSLPALFREWLADPLDMTASEFQPRKHERKSIPPTEEDTTLRHRRIQGEVQDENAWRMGGAAGHAGLFSNVTDLLKLAAEILCALRDGKGRLLERKTVEVFAERQMPERSTRALGWDTPSENSSAGDHFSQRSLGHLGYSGCSLWIDLESAIAVVLLTNRTWPDRKEQQIRGVRPAFHNAVRSAIK